MTGAAQLRRIGHGLDGAVASAGRVTLMVSGALRRALLRPRKLGLFTYQLLQVGVLSLPLVIAMAAFAGRVLAFQFGVGLERFGARLLIGQTTVLGIFRELGPILTALVAGGRIGAGIAAELGGMAVTEQIDAVRALGADPLARLVAPRLVAAAIAMPLLAVCADVVASAAAMLIAAIACHEGLRARHGTEGVGRAATRAVVMGALWVLFADFVLTKVLLAL